MAAGNRKPEDKNPATPPGERSLRDSAEEQLARVPKRSAGLHGQTPEQLVHELQVHQIELETQAEELRRVEFSLKESRDKFLDLYEFAPIGYLTLTDKALIAEVNLTGATLLGIERSRLVNHGLGRFIAPGDHEVWDRYFAKLRQHAEKQSCNLTLIRGNGSTFPARLEGIRISNRDGKTIVRIAISDITDIWQIEALRASEEKYRRLFETAKDGILILDEDTEMILDANTFLLDLLGFPRTYFIGKTLWELGFIRDKSLIRQAFTELKRNRYIRTEDLP
ncbi:MAG: PAS domain-containing protein, partial [Methanoregula sp.]|nr:PAS domain-containing protein [Methanoregula sp.]